MKDKARLIITGVVAALGLAMAIGGHGLSLQFGDDTQDNGGGNVSRSLAGLKDFDGVALGGPDDVRIAQGKAFSVRVEGEQPVLDRLNIFVRDGVLHVERKPGAGWSDSGGDATVHVVLPALRRLALSGSGDMSADRLSGDAVEAKVSGSGDLSIERVDARAATLATSGSGTLQAAGGRAGRVDYAVAGSGDIRADDVEAGAGGIEIAGSGNVGARISGAATISIQGSGDAEVTGTSSCTVSRSGSGEARCTS